MQSKMIGSVKNIVQLIVHCWFCDEGLNHASIIAIKFIVVSSVHWHLQRLFKGAFFRFMVFM